MLWLTGLSLGADILHTLETRHISFINFKEIGEALELERMQAAPYWVQALPLTPPLSILTALCYLAGRRPHITKRIRSRR